jgi:enoyl-CoA hydratase
MEMIFTAGMIKADEALQWGLVNHVVPQDQLLAKCNELATAIMKNSPSALASAIRAVNAGYEPGVNGLQREIEEFGKCFGTADFKEGTSAFMEKRKANFTGQ